MRKPSLFLSRILYNFLLLPAGTTLAFCSSPFHNKLKLTLRARRGLKRRWLEKATAIKSAPIWFHVSSVGEYEQAKPVTAALGERCPDIPVAMTFLSPSGYNYALKKETAKDTNIKFLEYLPLDFTWNARFCLALLKPRLLVFVKFDLWPNLIWKAKDEGIPVILMDGTLSETSYRFSSIGRSFYQSVYMDIDNILAISSADARRFEISVPRHGSLTVSGDTRFDRVAQRRRQLTNLPIGKGSITNIIAGSTWPPDEERILPALERLFRERKNLRVIIAPHEPTDKRVSELSIWAQSQGVHAERFSELKHDSLARVIIVDIVGVLAELYRIGDIAYVGGSFSSGVHSVIEPAIMAIPILIGPVHKNSHEAIELLRLDAGIEVSDSDAAYSAMDGLLRNAEKRGMMGARAKTYIDSQLGATEACLQAIAEHLPALKREIGTMP
jgi:3-deoxy-D-manno-octulosonic-acid transferase